MSAPQQTNQNFQAALVAADYERVSQIEKNFVLLKKFNDPRFGQVALIELPNNRRKLLCKEKIFNSKADLAKEIVAAKKRQNLTNPNLLNFVDYSTGSRSDFCASFHWIKLYFEYPDHDVEQELRRRARFNIAGLNGDELTHLLYQVSEAGAYLNSNLQVHGDISPETIEMDGPERFRLVEKFGDLATPRDAQVSKIFSGQQLFVAPEIYSSIKTSRGANTKSAANNNSDLEKADVFSLGLTILQAGLDRSVQGIYLPNGNISTEQLENFKRQFANRFGADHTLLTTSVINMLNPNPAERPTFSTLVQKLPAYAQMRSVLQQERARGAQNLQLASSNIYSSGGNSNYVAGVNQNPVQAKQMYEQYVSNATWETEWGNPTRGGIAPQAQAAQGPLNFHAPNPQFGVAGLQNTVGQFANNQFNPQARPTVPQGVPQGAPQTFPQGVPQGAPQGFAQAGQFLNQGAQPTNVPVVNNGGNVPVVQGNTSQFAPSQIAYQQNPYLGQSAAPANFGAIQQVFNGQPAQTIQRVSNANIPSITRVSGHSGAVIRQ